MKPKYPLYIPSKGRSDSRLTVKSLERMGVDYNIVVEGQEYDDYARVIDEKKIIVLPEIYFEQYDTLDRDGVWEGTGPGAARNFIWDHSTERGFKRHWVMDDNIQMFLRFNNNLQIPSNSGAIFRAMEDFCDRYENVGMAGPNYYMFVPRKAKHPPVIMNTRIYSCNLIKNDIPFRWRGRYNEDTDLSLRILKSRLCTVQFNAFLQLKTTTMTMKGGNTEMYQKTNNRKEFAELLVRSHPDVARVVWKFNRWHHEVNYQPFKPNRLIRKPDYNEPKVINDYGMILRAKDASDIIDPNLYISQLESCLNEIVDEFSLKDNIILKDINNILFNNNIQL